MFGVACGDNFGLAETQCSVEPNEFVPSGNRIIWKKLVVDVALTSFGVVYRHDFGILLVYSVSGNLKNDDPLVGILVAVEIFDLFGTRWVKTNRSMGRSPR